MYSCVFCHSLGSVQPILRESFTKIERKTKQAHREGIAVILSTVQIQYSRYALRGLDVV